MTVRDRSPRDLALGTGALLGVTGALFVLGGVPGLLFGLVAAAAWTLTAPVFAFVIGQAGIAAVVDAPYPPLVVAAEFAVLALLVSDRSLPPTARTWGVPVLGSTALGLGVWVAYSHSLAAAAVLCLAGATALTYAVHRYELLVTDQLEEATSNE